MEGFILERGSQNESIWWRDLKKVYGGENESRWFNSFLEWKVGNNSKIRFWEGN